MDIEPGPLFDMELSSNCIMEPMSKSTGQTELGSDLYSEPVVQLTWVGSNYSVEPGSIMDVEPVVLFAYRRAYNSQSNV